MGKQATKAIEESHARSNLALCEQFYKHLASRAYSPHTLRAYDRVVRDFLSFAHNGNLDELSHLTIREFIHWLQSHGLRPQSIARETFALKAFFTFLERLGIVEWSPARRTRNRRLPKHLPRWLTEKEMERFLAAADNPRDKAIVEVAYATGCRIAELSSIRLENLDFGDGTVGTIKIVGKGGKERMVYFGQPAARSIKKSLGRRRNGYLFIADGHLPDSKRPLTSRMIRSIINAVAHRAGLGHLNPRAIRNSFANHLLDRGADLAFVSKLLGHKNISTTAIYLHTSTARLTNVMRRCHPRWRKGKHGE